MKFLFNLKFDDSKSVINMALFFADVLVIAISSSSAAQLLPKWIQIRASKLHRKWSIMCLESLIFTRIFYIYIQ